jgi:integrase
LLPATSRLRRIVHHPALPYPSIGAFMKELRQQEGIAARALEFLILTAARSGEGRGAVWTEFNLADRLWVIPGERMKAGREHRVPLSDPALTILERLGAAPQQELSELVFPLGPMAMSRVLKGIPGGAGLTTHGFRSSFRDYCAELTAYPYEVAELALAHGVGNATARAYQRGDLFDKRRRLMEDWGQFCAAQPATGSVILIRGAAAIG